jgi:hypothetical protein
MSRAMVAETSRSQALPNQKRQACTVAGGHARRRADAADSSSPGLALAHSPDGSLRHLDEPARPPDGSGCTHAPPLPCAAALKLQSSACPAPRPTASRDRCLRVPPARTLLPFRVTTAAPPSRGRPHAFAILFAILACIGPLLEAAEWRSPPSLWWPWRSRVRRASGTAGKLRLLPCLPPTRPGGMEAARGRRAPGRAGRQRQGPERARRGPGGSRVPRSCWGDHGRVGADRSHAHAAAPRRTRPLAAPVPHQPNPVPPPPLVPLRACRRRRGCRHLGMPEDRDRRRPEA